MNHTLRSPSLLGVVAAMIAAALAPACRSATAETSAAGTRSAAASSSKTEAQVATARLHVEGMACERCSARLSTGLKKVAGIVDAVADHVKKQVVVQYDSARVTPAQIRQEIERLGFEVGA